MNNKIDSLFRKKLANKSCEPPPHIWENIAQRLDARKKKKRIALWSLSAAATLALLFSLSWLWELDTYQKEIYTISELSNVSTKSADTATVAIPAGELPDNHKPVDTEIRGVITNISKVTKQEEHIFTPVNIRKNMGFQELKGNRALLALNTNTLRRDFIPITSKAALENNKLYLGLLKESSSPAVKEGNNDKIRLSLSGHVAPIYSSGKYDSSVKSRNGSDYSSDQMNGTINISGGLKLSVATGKRLSIQTGLFYTQTGQRTTGNNVYVPRMAMLSAGADNSVATPLGNIKSKSRAVVYKTESPVTMNANSESGSIEQVFGSLEIPLNVKYQLNNNKVKFTVMGGLSGSFIVNNQAFLKYNNRKELMGSTEDIRNFNLSTDFGLGMEYPISRKVKIMLEPGFRYFLQSLSQNPDITFKPYVFSLSTGIGISF